MKIRISKTWLVILIIVLAIAGYFVVKSFLKNPTDAYITEKVSTGEILQEISETGSIKATENLSLSFKSAGKISKIYVAVGDDVKKGDILAELDPSQSSAQLQNAQAALEAARRQYDKLLNGLTQEDVKTYQNAVDSAKNDLQSAYESSLNTLNDAYTKIYNAYTTIVSLQSSYFSSSDQQGIKVADARNDISSNMQNIKTYLDGKDIDTAISKMITVLDNVYNDLKIIREQSDDGIYYSKVSSTDKTSLDTQKGYINTASASVTSAQQDVKAYKIALQKAEDNLSLETAAPRPEDINIYQAQVNQAQANVNLYQSQMGDAYLRSPIDGKIIDVNAKRGEVASPSVSLINLLSSEPFQIKVNIYERDIVNVKIDNLVKITLVAFPKQTFGGKVILINPGEKIVDNVVYYEVTVDFPNQPEGIKSGMTADIVIETNRKDNVLRVPNNIVENIGGIDTVQVANNGKIEDRQITTGLEGNDYVEVISGLSEGDKVITGKK